MGIYDRLSDANSARIGATQMFAEPLLLRLTSSMALLTLHFVIRPEWEYDVAFSPNGNPFKSQREISAVEEDLSSNYVIPILRLISDETRPANNVMSTTLFFAPNKKELHPFALRFGNVFIADDIHTNASFTVSFWCKHGFALGISIEFIDPMQTGTTPISVHKTIAAPAICDTSNNGKSGVVETGECGKEYMGWGRGVGPEG